MTALRHQGAESFACTSSFRCRYPAVRVTGLLDAAGGETRDDAALEDQYNDDERDRDDYAGRHLRAERLVETVRAGELGDRYRGGLHLLLVHHAERDDELVPRGDEGDDRGGEDARGRQQDDVFVVC